MPCPEETWALPILSKHYSLSKNMFLTIGMTIVFVVGLCFFKTDLCSYLVWFIFFKKCSSNDGKCSVPSLCWYEAVALHCCRDNYNYYYLLEVGLKNQNRGIFLGSPGACWCSGPSACNSLSRDGHRGCTGLLQPIKSCQPSPTTSSQLLYMQVDSPCSSVYLRNLNWVIRNLGFVTSGLTHAPKSRRNYKPVTHAFGKPIPCFQAVAPGNAQEGGQGTDLLPSVFCHTSARRGARALIGGCILTTVLNGHWWLLLPFFWLNPVWIHLYFCQGELTNLIRCVWKDTGFCSF